MIDLISPLALGIISGLISGFIPGVGNFATLLILLPILYQFDPIQILVLYVALTTISQYIGSIPAITYGVPGESSSIPAVIESKNLKNSQEVYQSIVQSAIGSTFGGLVVLLVTWLSLDYIMLTVKFFDTKVQLLLYCFMLILMTFILKTNKWYINILLMILGMCLGMIGYNKWFQSDALTFGISQLYGGIPLVIVMIGLLGIPEILKNFKIKQSYKPLVMNKIKINFNLGSSVWYSLIGFIGGLAPGLTTTMSSQLAYLYSKIKKSTPVQSITASETANNAGAFSQLIPLILLGIPLVGSEALVLNLIEAKGYFLGITNFETTFGILAICLLVVNGVGLVLAWPLASRITKLFNFNINFVYIAIILIFIGVIIWIGIDNYQLFFYMITFLLILPLSYLLRKYDTMPLIFAFLIHDRVFELSLRTVDLYFS
jgi:putative tricarboxylic transport membrane protein|tara:strand:+ start:1853 stop:3145 length:1293 start_codon:yes stop_codon:yes gene_type:complete